MKLQMKYYMKMPKAGCNPLWAQRDGDYDNVHKQYNTTRCKCKPTE